MASIRRSSATQESCVPVATAAAATTTTHMIPIHSTASDDEIPIWAMIEVNGELLEPKDENGGAGWTEDPDYDDIMDDADPTSSAPPMMRMPMMRMDPNFIELGAVHFVDDKTPVMIVGTHELKGTVEDLAQPFCVLQKGSSPTNPDDPKEYKITGLVNRKIVFNRYPKTIMR